MGTVTLLELVGREVVIDEYVRDAVNAQGSSRNWHLLNCPPDLKSSLYFSSILRRVEYMPFGSEVGGHDPLYLEKALRMIGRFEALHPAFPLSGRLVRVLCTVIEVPVLTVSNGRHYHSFRRSIASELVGDHYARRPSTGTQKLTKETDRGTSITSGLH